MLNFDPAALQESARRHNARLAAQQQLCADALSPTSPAQPNCELPKFLIHTLLRPTRLPPSRRTAFRLSHASSRCISRACVSAHRGSLSSRPALQLAPIEAPAAHAGAISSTGASCFVDIPWHAHAIQGAGPCSRRCATATTCCNARPFRRPCVGASAPTLHGGRFACATDVRRRRSAAARHRRAQTPSPHTRSSDCHNVARC